MSRESQPRSRPSDTISLAARFIVATQKELGEPLAYEGITETTALREGLAMNALGLDNQARRARAARAARATMAILRGRMYEINNHELDAFSVAETEYGLNQLRQALTTVSRRTSRSRPRPDQRLTTAFSRLGPGERVIAARLVSAGLSTVSSIGEEGKNDGTLITPAELWPENQITDQLPAWLVEGGYFERNQEHATAAVAHVRRELTDLLFLAVDTEVKRGLIQN